MKKTKVALWKVAIVYYLLMLSLPINLVLEYLLKKWGIGKLKLNLNEVFE